MKTLKLKNGDVKIFFHIEREKRNICSLFRFLEIEHYYNLKQYRKVGKDNYGYCVLKEKSGHDSG